MDGFAVGALVEIVKAHEVDDWHGLRPGDKGVVVSGPYRPRPPPWTWADRQDVLFGNVVAPVAVPMLREILPPPAEEIEEEEDAAA